jgi:hypothetical protein
MPTPPVRLRLAPGTTAHQLMDRGMPESSAYHALKRGWYCPGYNQRDYQQYDGPGGFAIWRRPSASYGPLSCARWRSGRWPPARNSSRT